MLIFIFIVVAAFLMGIAIETMTESGSGSLKEGVKSGAIYALMFAVGLTLGIFITQLDTAQQAKDLKETQVVLSEHVPEYENRQPSVELAVHIYDWNKTVKQLQDENASRWLNWFVSDKVNELTILDVNGLRDMAVSNSDVSGSDVSASDVSSGDVSLTDVSSGDAEDFAETPVGDVESGTEEASFGARVKAFFANLFGKGDEK